MNTVAAAQVAVKGKRNRGDLSSTLATESTTKPKAAGGTKRTR